MLKNKDNEKTKKNKNQWEVNSNSYRSTIGDIHIHVVLSPNFCECVCVQK